MVEKKKAPAKKKAPVKKKVVVKKAAPKVQEPKVSPFSYLGREHLDQFMPNYKDDIAGLVKKFQNRYGIKLSYVHKFRSFKLLRQGKHVDWIELNELMKRYDCRTPAVAMALHPQRPYKQNRIY